MKHFKIIIIILMIATFYRAYSCSCEKLSSLNKREINSAPQILIGEVIGTEHIGEKYIKAIFRVTENLKNSTKKKEIEIWTYSGGGASCGLNFLEGQQWYIFTYYDDGKVIANYCGRSALLTEHNIPPNPYKNRYFNQAVRKYKKNKRRAKREIIHIRKN